MKLGRKFKASKDVPQSPVLSDFVFVFPANSTHVPLSLGSCEEFLNSLANDFLETPITSFAPVSVEEHSGGSFLGGSDPITCGKDNVIEEDCLHLIYKFLQLAFIMRSQMLNLRKATKKVQTLAILKVQTLERI